MTVPFFRGIVGLNRERPVAGRRLLAAVEETRGPRFGADLFEIGKGHAVEIRGLFNRYLRHQFVDVNETLFLHEKRVDFRPEC